MKKLNKLLKLTFTVLFALATQNLYGQSAFPTGYEWVVPRASQQAKVFQKLGVTDIEVVYSRPMAKDRQLWGNNRIAPFDKVWRAGANEATVISFSTDVQIAGEYLKAGKYAFFVEPTETGAWTVIFNNVYSQWGAFTYDESKDALRVAITPSKTDHMEALEFSFPTLSEDKTEMALRWGSQRLLIPISVDVDATSVAKVKNTFDWTAGFFAAQHFLDIGNYPEALRWVNASIAMQENYSNLNQKIGIFEKMNNKTEALKTAKYLLKLSESKDDNRSKSFQRIAKEKITALGG